MVRDVTASWRSGKVTASGVYVLRGRIGEHGDLVRVGVAGVRGGGKGLYGRLDRHERPWPGKKTVGTHEVQPFVVVRAWELPDWSKVELASAEHCIYRAFAVRYPRRAEGLPDASIYVAVDDGRFDQALCEIDVDLQKIDALRQVPLV